MAQVGHEEFHLQAPRETECCCNLLHSKKVTAGRAGRGMQAGARLLCVSWKSCRDGFLADHEVEKMKSRSYQPGR